ncbi:uncharacterized protein C11orf96-like [Asterias rubens]|uniref:uncharacterized protein C11orf96-like n=1 Tax=Asterias rubens TaxID=7604 RepID=UPI0014558B96|nr:uncharacterized protein C11orf96-like [Asterias rubens]
MATAMEPLLDKEDDLNDLMKPKSPYGEPLGKFHVTTEWPQPLPRSRHARRPRTDARYRTQPVTFAEIREVDEDTTQGRSPHEGTPRTIEEDGPQRLRIEELKCPVKLEALNAAIEKILKRSPEKSIDDESAEDSSKDATGNV